MDIKTKSGNLEITPNYTLYINNINEKIKPEGNNIINMYNL
jgi:hypothetical protein